MVKILDQWEDAADLQMGELPVMATHPFIFIGPIRQSGSFCLSCLKSRIREMELEDHYLNGEGTKEPDMIEQRLISSYAWKLQNREVTDGLFALNRNTKEVALLSTYKRGDCAVCSGDPAAKVQERKQSVAFNPDDPREHRWEDVLARLREHDKLIRGSRLSIINRESRSGDSYGIPMVETEVHHNGISLLSYGRTATYGKSRHTSVLESLERYGTAFPYGPAAAELREGEDQRIGLTLSEVMESAEMDTGAYTPEKKIRYREAEELNSREIQLIPEQVIYFDSHHVSGEPRYLFDSSNGSALGSTVNEASLFAMLELFERDAFLSTWYGQIPPVRIRESSIASKTLKSYLVALRKQGIRAHLFDISMELKIPTIWVLLEKEDAGEEDMAFYTAAASSFDLEDAIEKALIEATTAISVFQNVFRKQEFLERKAMLLENPEAVSRLEDHLLLYSNREAETYLRFALDTPHEKTMEELDQSYTRFSGMYEEVIGQFHEILKGISGKVFRAVTQNPNLDRIGFVNVKYIVPEMLTMTFGHQNRRIIRSRVEKAILLKGRGHLDEEWLKRVPHPFP
ncbi:MAG: YcaO-like family protein [Bhargavaea sp.]